MRKGGYTLLRKAIEVSKHFSRIREKHRLLGEKREEPRTKGNC